MLLAEFHQAEISERANRNYRWRSRLLLVASLLLLIFTGLALYQLYKPLPVGLDLASASYVVNEADLAFNFESIDDQQLFTAINQAQQYILIDATWFNNWSRSADHSKLLAEQLLAKKSASPDIKIDLLVDPFNSAYGALRSDLLEPLSAAGINVIIINQVALPTANPIAGALWQALVPWLDWLPSHGWLTNPWHKLGPKVTLRSYLSAWRFNPNERQVMITDYQGQLLSFFRLNSTPFGAHGFIKVAGPLAQSLYQAESSLARLADHSLYSLPINLIDQVAPAANRYAQVQLLTETKFKSALLAKLESLSAGDHLSLAVPTLTDQQVLSSLIGAASRGVQVDLLLAPNSASLASAAHLQSQASAIKLKFSDSLSSTMILAESVADHQLTIFSSNADLTRRQLDGYTLSSALLITLNTDWDLAPLLRQRFDRLWQIASVRQSPVMPSAWPQRLIRWQEFTSLGSF